ncbi:delta-lactam-biosynthetic de-N-acetylase [Clostridium rectalis]|uniref:delta-lactam-biosynthetic de-N-acetylase n=1 Tax=Clostridium rectalis TaxID=2040295 RepID=UPI000F62D914|nr:delta-lactam-biosynthetic de-N-acetylase [Clostridium rectalis]
MKKKTLALSLCLTLCLTTIGCKSTNSKTTNYLNKNISSNNIKNKITDSSKERSIENSTDVKETVSKSNNKNYETKERDWFFAPEVPTDIQGLIKNHSAYYLGDTSKKVIYLTFDEGYENGYTPKILDILKDNKVKAAFFVVVPYINSNKDLIKRMSEEGHLVCNHSNHHPSMAKTALKGKDAFNKELLDTEKAYEDATGKKMPKFFRPPMGKYSELSLEYTKQLGYKTIFWSFAYHDWDINKQPSHDFAKKKIINKAHNGGIFLLHAVSKTNTEILDSVIKELKAEGYRFGTLDELK